MPMTGAGLKEAITDAIQGNLGENERTFDAVWLEVATAIVNYIKANAVVSGAVSVTSVSGVTTGGGVSGPGTGSMSAGTIA